MRLADHFFRIAMLALLAGLMCGCSIDVNGYRSHGTPGGQGHLIRCAGACS